MVLTEEDDRQRRFHAIGGERWPAVNQEVLLQLEGMEEHITHDQIKEKGRPWRELIDRRKLRWWRLELR
jgi:hypothetical protein